MAFLVPTIRIVLHYHDKISTLGPIISTINLAQIFIGALVVVDDTF